MTAPLISTPAPYQLLCLVPADIASYDELVAGARHRRPIPTDRVNWRVVLLAQAQDVYTPHADAVVIADLGVVPAATTDGDPNWDKLLTRVEVAGFSPSEQVFEHPLGAMWLRVTSGPPTRMPNPVVEPLSCVTQPSFQAKVRRRFAAVGAARGLTRGRMEHQLATYRPRHQVTAEQILRRAADPDESATVA